MPLKCKHVDIRTIYAYTGNSEDRRKENQTVGTERRSGLDRRRISRYDLDNDVRSDFYSVKNTYDNFVSTSNKFLGDVCKFDDKAKSEDHKKNMLIATTSLIPHFNKFIGVEKAFEQGDLIKTLSKWTLQIINIRADNMDIKESYEQLKNRQFKIYDTQIPFSFIRNTALEDSQSSIIKKLYRMDKTLFQTKTISKLVDAVGIRYDIIDTGKTDKFGMPVDGFKFKGNIIQKIIGRSLVRITVLGLIFNALIELPSIIKAENKQEQVLKSATNVGAITICSAIAGATLAYFGSIGSLVGIGCGLIIADKISNRIN